MISFIINFISDIITLICKIIKLQKETSKDINNDDKIINFLRKTLEEKDNIIIDLRKENKSLNEINKNNNLIITKKDNIIIELKKEIINLKDIIELNNF
jgi:hypothetical protein